MSTVSNPTGSTPPSTPGLKRSRSDSVSTASTEEESRDDGDSQSGQHLKRAGAVVGFDPNPSDTTHPWPGKLSGFDISKEKPYPFTMPNIPKKNAHTQLTKNTKVVPLVAGQKYEIRLYAGIRAKKVNANGDELEWPTPATDTYDIDSSTNKPRLYVFLGASWNNCYIELEFFKSMLEEQKVKDLYPVAQAYAAWQDKKNNNVNNKRQKTDPSSSVSPPKPPFRMWDINGTYSSAGNNNLFWPPAVPTVLNTSWQPQADWALDLWQTWDIAVFPSVVAAQVPDGSFNVLARFMAPAVTITLVFTPGEDEVELDEAGLKTLVEQLKKTEESKTYTYTVMSWKAAKAANLEYLSSSLFLYFHTWISSADFKAAFNSVRNYAPDLLLREWPDDATCKKVDDSLYAAGQKQSGVSAKTVSLNTTKLEMAEGKRKSKGIEGQATVMGGVSASDVAVAFNNAKLATWATKTFPAAGARPVVAEWLHRSAFHYGGLEDAPIQIKSSQHRDNLVFGTSESNTHMIREENLISSVIKAHNTPTDGGATLTTAIINSGKMTRTDQAFVVTTPDIPAWAATKAYKWLAYGLSYKFLYTDKTKNIPYEAEKTYDPFSRYYPFRCEAALDALAFKAVFDKNVAAGHGPLVPAKKPAGNIRTVVNVPHINIRTVANSPQPNSDPTHVEASQAGLASDPNLESNGAAAHFPSVAPVSAPTSVPGPLNMTHDGIAIPGTTGAVPGSASSVIPTALTSGSVPAADDFSLQGDITLFGVQGLTAKFYSWKGPLPSGIVMGLAAPIYERAVLDNDFHLSTVISKLKGTAFDKITLQNVTFTYQNYPFDSTKALGWHIEADVPIDESCGEVHDFLRKALGVQEPTLVLQAGLGSTQNWSMSLKIPSFTLDGTFPGIKVKICDELTMTSIGIRLMGIRAMERRPQPTEVMKYGFGVFGTMNVNVPGSVVPLELQYQILYMGGSLSLAADLIGGGGGGGTGDVWTDALGVKGLDLTDVAFSANLGMSEPLKSFNFGLVATFSYGNTTASFEGSYAAGGAFAISATLVDFDLANVADLCEKLAGESFTMPTQEVVIEFATIAFASGTGLTISLQNVQIAGHTAADAMLTISSAGVTLHGEITDSNNDLKFGDAEHSVELKKAFFQIDFQKTSSGKTTDILLGGEITIESFTFDAAVHLYEDGSGSAQWTIYSALTDPGQRLSLSKVVPALQGSFLDKISLTQVAFCAASKDDPLLSSFIVSPSPYTFSQGVQFFATLGTVDAMAALMKAPASGFILRIGWSKAGFTLDITPPTPTFVHLGYGISTDPFTLQIQLGGLAPSLMLSAGVQIPTGNPPTPLDFKLAITIDELSARASAELDGYWVDPLGISKQISIGPHVILSIEIIFAVFATTGTPSGFGIAAGLAIGKASANMALEISEDPMHELLSAEVENLDIQDVVSFAGLLMEHSLPQPPDFLQLQDLKLYICPTQTTIGTVSYPRGFSFDASMIVFEKHAEISCNVSTSGATLKGGIDNFKLGPLEVRGTTGPQASVDVEIGLSSQHLIIDGMATFFDAEVSLTATVVVMPSPAFAFHTLLKFTDLLSFKLDADLDGAVSFKSLEDADFVFDAELEQNILQYVADELNKQFDLAKQAANEGVESATKKVNDAKQAMQAGINDAKQKLNEASATWDKKRTSVIASNERVINEYNAKLQDLEGQVTRAKANYARAQAEAQAKLCSAQNERAAKISAARHAVDNARQNMTRDIANAHRRVSAAQASFSSKFGNAENSIRNAENKVDDLQRQITSVKSQMNHLKGIKKIEKVGLGVKLGGLEAAKGTADGVLTAARKTVQGVGYASSKAAIGTADLALAAAQRAGPVALSAANESLSATDRVTAAAVTAAKATADGVGKGTEAVAFKSASGALEAFRKANDAAFAAANAAIRDVMKCAEHAAFETATLALNTAKHASSSLDAADVVLKAAEDGGDLALSAAKWAVDHAATLCDIRKIELSGSLRGIIGLAGKVEKPLTACVEGTVVGKDFRFDGTFDPRKTAHFIASIFEKVWGDLKSIHL